MAIISLSSVVLFVLFVNQRLAVGFSKSMSEFVDDLLAYCSDVSLSREREMYIEKRQIPKPNTKIYNAELKQVQVLIRHGSRTIHEPTRCWPGFASTFDCRENGLAITNSNHTFEQFTFPVKEDADLDKQLPNECSYGQLLSSGYAQQALNGISLAQAYFTGDNPLINLTKAFEQRQKFGDLFYLRASAFERTRMSGTQLLSSLIKAVNPAIANIQIPLHTVDVNWEFIFPNTHLCPDLTEIKERSLISDDYLKRFAANHYKARQLADRMFNLEKEQPGAWPKQVFDCLYTTVCGNHDLPHRYSAEDLRTILAATGEEWRYEWTFNHGEFAKKGISRLMVEMKGFILKMLPKLVETSTHAMGYDEIYKRNPGIRAIPFVLWSGHDSSVASIIVSFGETLWNVAFSGNEAFPPYASMAVLEVYDSNAGPMIRLIYNSKVLTQYIRGCPSDDELCPIEKFFEATAWASPQEALHGCTLKQPVSSKWKFSVKMAGSKARPVHHRHVGCPHC